MATTKKPNEEEVLLEEPVANPSLKINPTENYNKATATPYQAPTWNGGTGVGAQANSLAQKAINMNYTDWTKGTDYASLTKRYSQQGQKAMDNTIGMAAARTGGMASSYATAAGNQAYNDYMGKLEDAARALYESQRAEAKDNYGIAQGIYDRQYGEYVDDKNFGYQQYRDNVGDAQWADTMYSNQYNTEWNQDFQQGQYDDSQAEGEEIDLETTLYYSPDTYPDYASYKAANPNTKITEARFNEIRATATGKYADDNKEWDYETAEDEEQELYDYLFATNGGMTYAEYMTQNPDSTMTEGTFERILGTAEGDYALSQQGRNDAAAATDQDNARAEIQIQLQNNPDAEISDELLQASGWSEATIEAYRGLSRDAKSDVASGKATEESAAADALLSDYVLANMTWDEIMADPKAAEAVAKSTRGESYWKQQVENVATSNAEAEQDDARGQVEMILSQGGTPSAELLAATGWDELTINAYEMYYEGIASEKAAANATAESKEADAAIVNMLAVGMTIEEIQANPEYAEYLANSTFGEDYWNKMEDNLGAEEAVQTRLDNERRIREYIANGGKIDNVTDPEIQKLIEGSGLSMAELKQMQANQGYTNSQIKAQDELEMIINSGKPLSGSEMAELVKKSGMSKNYWKAYEKIVKAGAEIDDETEEAVAKLTDPEKIDVWSDSIEQADTYEKAIIYAERLAELDFDLADELMDMWKKAHNYSVSATPSTSTSSGNITFQGTATPAGNKHDKEQLQ